MYMMTARKYWEMALAAAEPLEVDVEGRERVEVETAWQSGNHDGPSGTVEFLNH